MKYSVRNLIIGIKYSANIVNAFITKLFTYFIYFVHFVYQLYH